MTLPKLGGTSWLLCSQCAYFELIASIHKPVPSLWGEGQGEGGEYKILATLDR